MLKIAVAGASGFIGSHLIQNILEKTEHSVVALSRSRYESDHERLSFRQANLYSLLELEKALEGCDTAVYLVHSMATSSRLAQGSFNDFDFVLADNFARACKRCGVKQIIYIGGIIPPEKKLSTHLESRREVEVALAASKIPLLAVRCGLIIGPGGSSFEMLKKLVHRLPVMVLPYWTETLNQPIFIDDLMEYLHKALVANEPLSGVVDLGGPEKLTYAELIKKMAKVNGSFGLFINFRYIPLQLSKLWVRLITGAAKQLVYPLVDSLQHEMIVREELNLEQYGVNISERTSVEEALAKSIAREKSNQSQPELIVRQSRKVKDAAGGQSSYSEVQSVQRLPFPKDKNVQWVAQTYLSWLPRFFGFFLYAENKDEICSIYSLGIKTPLLVLEHSEERSSRSRHLFYVRKGLMVSNKASFGRLEFREDPNQEFIISAIHRFVPALPWYIYRFTQALVHKYVMWRFGSYLSSFNEKRKS